MAPDGALVISLASAGHSGDYKCMAANEAGSVERKTKLKVNGEGLVLTCTHTYCSTHLTPPLPPRCVLLQFPQRSRTTTSPRT